MIPKISQKELAMSFRPHALKHQRAPSSTITWWPHTRGPRFRRGTRGNGTDLHHLRINNSTLKNITGSKEIIEVGRNQRTTQKHEHT